MGPLLTSRSSNVEVDFTVPSLEEINKIGAKFSRQWGKKPKYRASIIEIYHKIVDLYRPKVLWNVFPIISVQKDCIILENHIRLGNHIVSTFMEGTRYIFVCIASIGHEIDIFLQNLNKTKKMFEYVIADTIGNLFIGHLCSQFIQKLKLEQKNKGMYLTNSLAPGESTWGLKDQQVIFDLLSPELESISLNSFMVLSPSKSESFILGGSKEILPHPERTRCDFCDRSSKCRFFNNVLKCGDYRI